MNAIRYDAFIISPDLNRIKFDKTDKKKNINENIKKYIKKCWYCERECNTFISICDFCTKYRQKRIK